MEDKVLLFNSYSNEFFMSIEREGKESIIPKEFFSIIHIDNILKEFFLQYNLSDLLGNKTHFNNIIIVDYKIEQKTYNGALFNYQIDNLNTYNQLIIKLYNDGYKYKNKHSNNRYSGWYNIEMDHLKDMKKLKEIQNTLDTTIKVFYHPKTGRVDINFVNGSQQCILKICIEYGFAKYKDKYLIDLYNLKEYEDN